MPMGKGERRGFTLLEILVVLGILGTLGFALMLQFDAFSTVDEPARSGRRVAREIRYLRNHAVTKRTMCRLEIDTMDAAIKMFRELKMDETEAKNGVLIFIVPGIRQFSIIGDAGIDGDLAVDEKGCGKHVRGAATKTT